MFSWQIWDANLTDNSKIGDELEQNHVTTYFWQLILFKFIPYQGAVSQICISNPLWKYQQTTRWRLFSWLWYRHYGHPRKDRQTYKVRIQKFKLPMSVGVLESNKKTKSNLQIKRKMTKVSFVQVIFFWEAMILQSGYSLFCQLSRLFLQRGG